MAAGSGVEEALGSDPCLIPIFRHTEAVPLETILWSLALMGKEPTEDR
jgi:hypothetical protein